MQGRSKLSAVSSLMKLSRKLLEIPSRACILDHRCNFAYNQPETLLQDPREISIDLVSFFKRLLERSLRKHTHVQSNPAVNCVQKREAWKITDSFSANEFNLVLMQNSTYKVILLLVLSFN